MKNLLIIILILIVVGFIGGFIEYVDCRDCVDDFPFKYYKSIEFRKNPNNISADLEFTYCLNSKNNCNNLDFEKYKKGNLQWIRSLK